MKGKSAFTLIEVITVIGIIVLIAAIVFPVVANARKSAYKATSLAYLRQVGMAVSMYHETYDGYPLRHLDSVVTDGYIDSTDILKIQTDVFERGYGFEMSQCAGGQFQPSQETSFETVFSGPQGGLLPLLLKIDNNPGIVVDRTGGNLSGGGSQECRDLPFAYTGPMNRLRLDGSVQRAHFSTDPPPGSPSSVLRVFRRARLFTDVDISLSEI